MTSGRYIPGTTLPSVRAGPPGINDSTKTPLPFSDFGPLCKRKQSENDSK